MPNDMPPGAIDMHSHVITPEVLTFVRSEGARLQTKIVERDGKPVFVLGDYRTQPLDDRVLVADDGATRLRDMDAEGIACAVLSAVPYVMYPRVEADIALAVAQVYNDSVAELAARRPDRFVGWASVPLQAPERAARELERAKGLGLKGVQILPTMGDSALDESHFEPFWEAAAALDMPVLIHPFITAPTGVLSRYFLQNFAGHLMDTGLAAAAIVCGGVLERHPRLRIILCHAGGTLPAMIGRIDNGFPRSEEMRARITRKPSTYVTQLWMDTIAFNVPFLRALIEWYGPARFVFGTDYPMAGGPAKPMADIRELGLSPADERTILRTNAQKLLAPGIATP